MAAPQAQNQTQAQAQMQHAHQAAQRLPSSDRQVAGKAIDAELPSWARPGPGLGLSPGLHLRHPGRRRHCC